MKLNFNKLAKITAKSVILALALSFITAGCGGDDGDGDDGDGDTSAADAFDQRVRGSSEFDNPEELASPVILSESAPTTVTAMEVSGVESQDPINPMMEQVEYNCTTRRYRAAPGYNELFLLKPTTNVVYPGSVIRGESIRDGEYLPLSGTRKPLRISTSILGLTEVASVVVDQPSHGTIRDALRDLLSQDNTANLTPPANSVFTTTSVFSQTHLGIALGVNIEAQVSPTFQVGAGLDFSFSQTDEKQKFAARFAQRFFTVDIDLPGKPSDLFEDYDDVASGVSPVYVSTLTYGRNMLLQVESRRSQLDVNAALNASLRVQDRLSVDTNFSTEYRQVLANTSLNSYVVGGDGTACNGINDMDSLHTCVRDGGLKYQDALPISYTLRFLRDNSIAKVVLADEYTARECDLNPNVTGDDTVRWWITRIGNADNKEERGNGFDEVYGKIYMREVRDRNRNQGGGRIGCSISESSSTMLFERSRDQDQKIPGRNRTTKWLNLTGDGTPFYGAHDISDAYSVDEHHPSLPPQLDKDGRPFNFEICFDLWERDGGSGGSDDRYHYSLQIPQTRALNIGSECTKPYEIEFRDNLSSNASRFTAQLVRWDTATNAPIGNFIQSCQGVVANLP